MQHGISDRDLLESMSRHLGIDTEGLLRRYYGSDGDAEDELRELARTGSLQASFSALLRQELQRLEPGAD
jgi:hypothetical protein